MEKKERAQTERGNPKACVFCGLASTGKSNLADISVTIAITRPYRHFPCTSDPCLLNLEESFYLRVRPQRPWAAQAGTSLTLRPISPERRILRALLLLFGLPNLTHPDVSLCHSLWAYCVLHQFYGWQGPPRNSTADCVTVELCCRIVRQHEVSASANSPSSVQLSLSRRTHANASSHSNHQQPCPIQS